MPSLSIDIEFVYDRFIDDGLLDGLHDNLSSIAPAWCTDLRVYEGPRNQMRVDPEAGSSLADLVKRSVFKRGALFERLVELDGKMSRRAFGSAEIRGADSSLVVVVSLDQDPFWKIGGAQLMGNSISFQVRRAQVAGIAAPEWALDSFELLCGATDPLWASIRSPAEYRRKVMSDGPSVHAVGRDFSRYLPGLFSVNYFGERYVELIGREVLLHAPSERADTLGSGVIVVLDSTIRSHPVDTVVSGSAEADALDAIGRRHFFQKN